MVTNTTTVPRRMAKDVVVTITRFTQVHQAGILGKTEPPIADVTAKSPQF